MGTEEIEQGARMHNGRHIRRDGFWRRSLPSSPFFFPPERAALHKHAITHALREIKHKHPRRTIETPGEREVESFDSVS